MYSTLSHCGTTINYVSKPTSSMLNCMQCSPHIIVYDLYGILIANTFHFDIERAFKCCVNDFKTPFVLALRYQTKTLNYSNPTQNLTSKFSVCHNIQSQIKSKRVFWYAHNALVITCIHLVCITELLLLSVILR